jgi:hypothetical protein
MASAIEFDKQLDRPDMHEGLVGASEERFTFMPPKEDMRFRRHAGTDFSKWKPKCIDEFLNRAIAGTNDLNVFNQVYHPKYDFGKKNLASMVPCFEKGVSRS